MSTCTFLVCVLHSVTYTVCRGSSMTKTPSLLVPRRGSSTRKVWTSPSRDVYRYLPCYIPWSTVVGDCRLCTVSSSFNLLITLHSKIIAKSDGVTTEDGAKHKRSSGKTMTSICISMMTFFTAFFMWTDYLCWCKKICSMLKELESRVEKLQTD